VLMTVLYEKPIRQYLNDQGEQMTISHDVAVKAKKRVINEPFVLIALDASMWFLSAIVYSIIHWVLGTGSYWIQRAVYTSMSAGLITITVAFFFLEHILQKKLSPYFFPNGRLCDVPKTVRIRIRTRLVALLSACNLIPLVSMIYTTYSITISHRNFVPSFEHIRMALFTNALLFIGAGICLTMFVSRNLTLPFDEILSTLRNIRNGLFDKKVKVTSNDEIGYTGDVINEMSKGLQERE
jgi:adenylate cyclase